MSKEQDYTEESIDLIKLKLTELGTMQHQIERLEEDEFRIVSHACFDDGSSFPVSAIYDDETLLFEMKQARTLVIREIKKNTSRL